MIISLEKQLEVTKAVLLAHRTVVNKSYDMLNDMLDQTASNPPVYDLIRDVMDELDLVRNDDSKQDPAA